MVRTQRVQRSHIIDGAYQLIINEGFKSSMLGISQNILLARHNLSIVSLPIWLS